MLIQSCVNLHAATLYVWEGSTNSTPPYDSWATAAHVIQVAVDAAVDGDTVLVTNGVYSTGGRAVGTNQLANRVAIDKAVTLRSVNGPEGTMIEGAAAPGGGLGDGALRAAYVGINAVLSGFTLTNGHTRDAPYYVSPEGSGGGVWSEVSGTVTNCVLTGNSAWNGGGAYAGTLYGCTLIGNSADNGGGAYDSTLYNCTLSNNSAAGGGGEGGGAYECQLYRCVLSGNSSSDEGGGAENCELDSCTLRNNTTVGDGGGASDCVLYSCLLTGNSAGAGGGADEDCALYNCTLTGNSAVSRGGGVDGSDELFNCIVYDNTAPNGPNHSRSTFYYSCTTPLPTNGLGNITNEPAFLAAAAGNYRLCPGSPCVDAGTNLSSILTHDFDGKPRPIDGNGDGMRAYDIGAYEFGVVLEIERADPGSQATLSWVASPEEFYVLEETTSIPASSWDPSATGSQNPVTVDMLGAEKYFRLRQALPGMVWISPGTFLMGSPGTEALRSDNELQHEVTIRRGFWMGKHEVTQGEYLDVTGTNPSYWRNGTEAEGSGGSVINESRHPVEQVSWFDATHYCGLLAEQERLAGRLPEGYVYRLPTEAEWEYACRAGTTTAFFHGFDLRSGEANFVGTQEYDASAGTINNPAGTYLGRTTEVGSYQANAWGLHDMHGNVWEWCQDFYGAYPLGPVTDPTGPETGSDRMARGSAWQHGALRCRSAARNDDDPNDSSYRDGFRVVLGHPYPLE